MLKNERRSPPVAGLWWSVFDRSSKTGIASVNVQAQVHWHRELTSRQRLAWSDDLQVISDLGGIVESNDSKCNRGTQLNRDDSEVSDQALRNVSEGSSPNTSEYFRANRLKSQKPKRAATLPTLAKPTSASLRIPRARWSRCNSR